MSEIEMTRFPAHNAPLPAQNAPLPAPPQNAPVVAPVQAQLNPLANAPINPPPASAQNEMRGDPLREVIAPFLPARDQAHLRQTDRLRAHDLPQADVTAVHAGEVARAQAHAANPHRMQLYSRLGMGVPAPPRRRPPR